MDKHARQPQRLISIVTHDKRTLIARGVRRDSSPRAAAAAAAAAEAVRIASAAPFDNIIEDLLLRLL